MATVAVASRSKSNSGALLSLMQSNSVAVAAIVIIMFMFVPLNRIAIDIAMALNLAAAIVILLSVLNMKRSADFSSFPRVVLFFTLFGIAINISSTRNILTHPVMRNGDMPGQSEIVKSFANIVTGNNVLVGFIIFIILIVVQMLVITKGADRVSEVTARFTLDSMNNKMFVIQNQMNSGAITEEEAELKIAQLRQEIDFYSQMDGSSKFVSGNVKAGIFITIVNLIGGMVTGMMFNGLDMATAINSYAKLTIGDGLISQLPALILSFSTGLLITGNNEGDGLTDQLRDQFTKSGVLYVIVGVTICVMGIAFHNGSTGILLPVGLLFIVIGRSLSKSLQRKADEEAFKAAEAKAVQQQKAQSNAEVSAVAKLDDLSLEIGYALIPLVDKEKSAELLERVKRIRRESALELGLVIPPIHIMDQMELDPETYLFRIRGIDSGRGRLKMGHYLCLNTGGVPKDRELHGESARDPAFGMAGIWIPEARKMEAEKAGYAVIDAPTIIATHLTELIRRNAAKILSRQSVSNMLDEIKKSNSVAVEEVLTGENRFSYGEIEGILRNLLDEQVSIRNMVTILETLGDYGRITRDTWTLTEKVREALGAQICQQYADENKTLHVITLSQSLSQTLLDHKVVIPGKGPLLGFDPVDSRKYISIMSSSVASVRERNFLPIILAPSEVRRLVKASLEMEMPGIIVLSHNEVMVASSGIKIESLGEINWE